MYSYVINILFCILFLFLLSPDDFKHGLKKRTTHDVHFHMKCLMLSKLTLKYGDLATDLEQAFSDLSTQYRLFRPCITLWTDPMHVTFVTTTC